MKNRFFEIALSTAGRVLGKKARILLVLAQLGRKLKDVEWKNVKVSTARDKFFVLGRLVKAYALGHYRNVPLKTMLLILAAVIYFISPVDLIPDLIPITGLSDDFGILLWVYNSVLNEIDKFLTWEKSQLIHDDGSYRG
jgi:uncharacterized membrane protein YkvA (DUF1232 family)